MHSRKRPGLTDIAILGHARIKVFVPMDDQASSILSSREGLLCQLGLQRCTQAEYLTRLSRLSKLSSSLLCSLRAYATPNHLPGGSYRSRGFMRRCSLPVADLLSPKVDNCRRTLSPL